MLGCFFSLDFENKVFLIDKNYNKYITTKKKGNFFLFLLLSKDTALFATPLALWLILLFKEKRKRGKEKMVCWFLIRDWIKDVCSHNSITLSFCLNTRGRRRRKRKRGYILSSTTVCTAYLARIQNKKSPKL
jgi:hypothetical protein